MDRTLSKAEIENYHNDGYLIKKQMFSKEEIDRLYSIATQDAVTSHAMDFMDQTGKMTKLTLWFTPGDDPFGLMSRSERLINALRGILGEKGDICHFHSKIMQKEPKTGGAWEWHQDYGYWYKNGFFYADAMISVMVALTEATKENGCLQVLKGTHKVQRIEHHFVGEQQGADQPFVDELMKTHELEFVELEPGDVLFFHSNILHRSDANNSDKPRWSVISAYNLSYNIPFREKHMSCIEPINVVPDTALLSNEIAKISDADFLKKENEITLNVK